MISSEIAKNITKHVKKAQNIKKFCYCSSLTVIFCTMYEILDHTEAFLDNLEDFPFNIAFYYKITQLFPPFSYFRRLLLRVEGSFRLSFTRFYIDI